MQGREACAHLQDRGFQQVGRPHPIITASLSEEPPRSLQISGTLASLIIKKHGLSKLSDIHYQLQVLVHYWGAWIDPSLWTVILRNQNRSNVSTFVWTTIHLFSVALLGKRHLFSFCKHYRSEKAHGFPRCLWGHSQRGLPEGRPTLNKGNTMM